MGTSLIGDAVYTFVVWTPFLALIVGFFTLLACGIPYLEVMTNGSETVFPNSISAIPEPRPQQPLVTP